ncbi:MAG: low affinity iron permease family protein [Xanthobacteraceae bacterium]
MSRKRSLRQHRGPGQVPVPRQDRFSWFAHEASRLAGKPPAFLAAFSLVVGWALTGPFVGFSETWQLFINTTTTIITFLMVFLIQSTQNRDTLAIQVKLAELILHMPGVPNQFADAEDMSERQLEHVHAQYKSRAREKMRTAGRRKPRRA